MRKIAIYGAGEYGKLIFNLIDRNKEEIVCFIDDNAGEIILSDFFPEIIQTDKINKQNLNFDEIIVAIRPRNLSNYSKLHLKELADRLSVNIRFANDLNSLLDNKLYLQKSLNDLSSLLLGREAKVFNNDLIRNFYNDKKILIAGGAGSIGSELINKLSNISSCKITSVDKNEEKVFWANDKFNKNKNITWKLGDLSNKRFVSKLFSDNKFDIVINAAAYKHVPLFEDNIDFCWRNNLGIVFNLDFYCKKYNVTNLLQVSTDKAVNPTNVMGASKRACELYLLNNRQKNKYTLTITRFGNVLGSSGSVLTIFDSYFSRGKPIPITDERITRYFMSIEEAVILLLESVIYSNNNKCLFLLDMGDPKNIIDLAEDFLLSKGVSPIHGENIEIVGLRPGEKLYEEMLLNNENNIDKIKDKIFAINLPKDSTENISKIQPFPKNTINKNYIRTIVKEYNGKNKK